MKVKLETWVDVAVGVVALFGAVVSVFALKTANKALESQTEESLRSHVASIRAKHDAATDTLLVEATEPDKTLNAVVMIFPTEFGIGDIEFELPTLAVEFDRIRAGVIRGISDKVRQGVAKSRWRIPVGVLTHSTHVGGAYESGSLYLLVLDFGQSVNQQKPEAQFVAFAHAEPINMPGFAVFKAPWKTLTEPEIDKIAYERRTKDVRALIDRYWNASRRP